MLRINYDAHNGHPYTAIGRILIERGLVPREEMSMDRIRQWMSTAPDGGKELRSNNKSYVFFRITGLSDDNEPLARRRAADAGPFHRGRQGTACVWHAVLY